MTHTSRYTVVPVPRRRAYWIGGQHQAVIAGGPETNNRYALSHSTIAVGGGALEHRHSREALEPTEVLILYAPAGLERFIAQAGLADPDAYQRSIDEAGAVLAAAPAYGVNYSALDKS